MAAEAEAVAEGGGELRGARGVRDDVHIDLGVEVFDVDGRGDDLIAQGEDAGGEFDAAGGSEEVPGHGFGAGDEQALLRVVAKGALDGAELAQIADGGGGGVRVDVADVGGVQLGVAQGHFHALGGAEAFRMRGGEVVGICGDAVAGEFGVNVRAALFGVLQLFDDDDAGAFAHDEAVAIDVPGA